MTERDANRSRPDDAGGMARDRGAPDQATVPPPVPPQAARRARPGGQREDDERDERDERETGGAGQAGGGVGATDPDIMGQSGADAGTGGAGGAGDAHGSGAIAVDSSGTAYTGADSGMGEGAAAGGAATRDPAAGDGTAGQQDGDTIRAADGGGRVDDARNRGTGGRERRGMTGRTATAEAGAGAGAGLGGGIAALAGLAWGAALAAALGMIAVGIMLLVWPKATLTVVAILIGAALLVAGVLRLVDGITTRAESGGARAADIVIGLLAILAGLYCLKHHTLTVVVLALVVGAFWIIHGVSDLVGAASSGPMPGRGLRVIGGLFSVAAGTVILFWPGISLILLLTILGAWLLFYGVVLGGLALRLRRDSRAVGKAVARTPHAAPA